MIETALKQLIADEVDGAACMRHVSELSQYHRSLGSREYHDAAEYLQRFLRSQGIEVGRFDAPLDNHTRIGNYTVPPAWEPRDAVATVVEPERRIIVSFRDAPTCINSWSAATPPEGVTAELVDVGDGDRQDDYIGKDVRGKICLTSKGYTWRTHPLAVEKFGALGFFNDDVLAMPPLKTRETFPDAVMWNTLYERSLEGGYLTGFGLSISPRTGDVLRDLLRRGPVRVHVRVDARTFSGTMENPFGIIRGQTSPQEEVLMAAHLCHPRPGAVDNAAGCAHITESLRVLSALIQRGALPVPKRSILSFYGPEAHHTNVYGARLQAENRLDDCIAALSSHAGGDPEQLHSPLVLTRTSPARPHFIDDLMADLLEQVPTLFPAPGPRARVPFAFEVAPRFMGGDSLQLVAWGLPSIELTRQPNIFWHTQYDTVERCSAEEFTKVGWVFATAAWFLANAGPVEALSLMYLVHGRSEARLRKAAQQLSADQTVDAEAAAVDRLQYLSERDTVAIQSCLTLVRNESAGTRQWLAERADLLAEQLNRTRIDAEQRLVELGRFGQAHQKGEPWPGLPMSVHASGS